MCIRDSARRTCTCWRRLAACLRLVMGSWRALSTSAAGRAAGGSPPPGGGTRAPWCQGGRPATPWRCSRA
eukprot:1918868-Pyramimonas_sp.AAC.1